jgi:hypothetical protein
MADGETSERVLGGWVGGAVHARRRPINAQSGGLLNESCPALKLFNWP